LLRLPHAVVRPGHGMLWINGKRSLIPKLGVVITAELAVGIPDQIRHVGVVVVSEGAQSGNAGGIVCLVLDHRVGRFVPGDEVFQRTSVASERLLLARCSLIG
jgi:hypothetical protein